MQTELKIPENSPSVDNRLNNGFTEVFILFVSEV